MAVYGEFTKTMIRLQPPLHQDGFIAYTKSFPKALVEIGALGDLKPIIGVRTESVDSINALRYDAQCRPGLGLQDLGTPTDRFALYLGRFTAATDHGAEQIGPTPELELELRGSLGVGNAEPLLNGSLKTTWGGSGLLFQFSGLLCVQWEIWGRVKAEKPDAQDVYLAMNYAIARCGADFGVLSGSDFTVNGTIKHI